MYENISFIRGSDSVYNAERNPSLFQYLKTDEKTREKVKEWYELNTKSFRLEKVNYEFLFR